MKPLRIVVVGTLANDPYAGMAWMHMQIVAGLRRLNHDAYYFETTSTWPYDPLRQARVPDSDYAAPYLARVAESFGLSDRWAYRRSFSDKAWLGMEASRAQALLAQADIVFNIAGATRIAEEGLKTGRLIYFGTDPVFHEVNYANGNPDVRTIINEHDEAVTYGENIGTSACPLPPLPNLRARTRQPVLLDCWQNGRPSRDVFTTVGNWKQSGLDVVFAGETYRWSKHHEFERFLDLPRRTRQPLELATNLTPTQGHGEGTAVPAFGVGDGEYEMLEANGWLLANGPEFSLDPWRYRDYIVASRAEFTVARDLNVRLQSGWFSERSACYLGAGRPVVTQDTGFGTVLPTGEGLFAYRTMEDILAAFDAIDSDYPRHARAAREIGHEYFRAETVLSRLIEALT